MRWLIVLLVVGSLFPTNSVVADESGRHPIKGMNVYFQNHDAEDVSMIDRLLDDLSSMGIDTIILNIPIYIDGWQGDQIGFVYSQQAEPVGGSSPTLDQIQLMIDRAKSHQIKVWLRPLLDETSIVESGGQWRGELYPSQPEVFFENYSLVLKSLLSLAKNQTVNGLIIGSEFNSLEAPFYEHFWTQLIEDLRADISANDYSIELIYAQNWDTGVYLGYPGWFGQLDAVAIDAYFPVEGLSGTPSADQIEQGLKVREESLQQLHRQLPDGHMYVTEFGLPSRGSAENTLLRPWDFAQYDWPVNLELQSNYISAGCHFFASLQADDGQPLVDGLFWWVSYTSIPDNPSEDKGYEVIGKPAQQVITDCQLQS